MATTDELWCIFTWLWNTRIRPCQSQLFSPSWYDCYILICLQAYHGLWLCSFVSLVPLVPLCAIDVLLQNTGGNKYVLFLLLSVFMITPLKHVSERTLRILNIQTNIFILNWNHFSIRVIAIHYWKPQSMVSVGLDISLQTWGMVLCVDKYLLSCNITILFYINFFKKGALVAMAVMALTRKEVIMIKTLIILHLTTSYSSNFRLLFVMCRISTRIFYRIVVGFATDCPCGVWCRGLATCLLYVGQLFRSLVWNESGYASSTYWRTTFHCF